MVIPNHLHGVLFIKNDPAGAYCDTPLQDPIENIDDHSDSTVEFRSPSKNVGAIIRGFKSTTPKQINILRKSPKHSVWQRNYWEWILRD